MKVASEYVDTVNLPATIQQALKAAGYSRSSIEVIAATEVQLGHQAFGDGYQAFTVLVNVATGETRTQRGSWGGVNPWSGRNAVDTDQSHYTLPDNGAAILGQRGGGHPTYATLYVPASLVRTMLPGGPKAELPKVERDALYCHEAIKGGQYRRDELRQLRVPPSVVDDLVARGLLKRNKAGATQITTAGRNAVGNHRGF